MHANDTLTYNNYADWSQEMMNFLFAKNKFGFIDESIKKHLKTVGDYMLWMRYDAMVKGWLTTPMEKDIRNILKYKESFPRAYKLKQILTGTQQAGTSVSAYYTKLRGLCCTCDIKKMMVDLREKERLYEFLIGFDTSLMSSGHKF
ncbi:reverse transcriptase, RNA-dependent DNA polymerase, Gag-polypeptide of LTR copia-type [Artemisia annua]|uniref:Reverse transcriptase, RNA-dependent DNA polymerase, Gag-polypeptide of LTR copia-type n=1 Tax=Artemisia annua TaxID=35608 RepID=A0A2U1N8X6_ARTAN|nr:reverse transcriptase, RNA-dependent DNA polymerase, Gag-polypeptide of LTR copia-type [Artemisia annua]